MAITYVNLATTTLGSSQSSVTFSNIDSTYTDLLIRYSARTSDSTVQYLNLEINGNQNLVYSFTYFLKDGASVNVNSDGSPNYTYMPQHQQTNSSHSANAFGTGEIYIPSYRSSINKQLFSFSTQETNSTTDHRLAIVSGLFSNTTVITSLTLLSHSSTNFVANSFFGLYGIKNA